MRKWKGLIGFSGTILSSVSVQLKLEFKDPSIIRVKSLRKSNLENRIEKVI
jgi:hypothetical protein